MRKMFLTNINSRIVVNKLLAKLLLKSPIAYHKCFAQLMKSASGGLFLSQVYYWWSNKSGEWNYKFNQEFMDELCLSEWELRKAKEKAIELQIIDFKLGKLGKLANVPFYKINEDILLEHLDILSQNIQVKQSPVLGVEEYTRGIENSSGGGEDSSRGLEQYTIPLESVSQPLYTENTTKITSEIKIKKSKPNFYKNAELELTPESEINLPTCNNSGNGSDDLKFDYSDFDETHKVAIEAWFTYRKEAKKKYKTKSSLTALRNKMLELKAAGLLIEAVNHSIAMEYTGLFPPNHSSGYYGQHAPPKKLNFNYTHDFTANKPDKPVDTF
ncbi:MAG: hypothetical protein KBD37_05545 [Burkholderiales bacterium]|nr:hypothetical protein [Burkholderiales bacterium]